MKTIYVVLHQPVPRTNSLVFLLASSSDLCTISSLVCNLKIGDSTVCREVDQSLKNIYILIENEKKRKQLKTTDNWNYQPLIDVPLFFNESTLLRIWFSFLITSFSHVLFSRPPHPLKVQPFTLHWVSKTAICITESQKMNKVTIQIIVFHYSLLNLNF